MTARDTDTTDSAPAPNIDRYRLESERDIETHRERNRRQIAANDTAARHRADRAAVARQKLAQTPHGADAIARTEAVRSGNPDAQTLALIEAMERAERMAAATAEGYLTNAGGVTEALHHCLPFAAEMQKLAADARYRMAGLHIVNAQGQVRAATTVNGDGKNLLTHVTVYPTSRPSVRWMLDESVGLNDVVAEIRSDTHCDCSAPPFAKTLAPYLAGKADCIADMAEDAANQRTRNDYWVNELNSVAPQHRDKCKRPQPVSVGLLFPVAFGSDVLVMKLCHGHAFALAEKYGIQLRDCGIEEPWESVGTYW